MHPVPGSSAWTNLVDTLAAHGLSDQLSHSAPDASWLQDGGEPEDAPSVAQFEALLPAAYRSFVAEQGYPLIVAPSPLNYAFAFLPPLAARQASAVVADGAKDFNAVREARSAGEYEWRNVMFAGWNFADGDGWAFGHDPDAEEGDEPLV